MSDIANRYSESLFDLALEQNKVAQYSKDMAIVNSIIVADPEVLQFFSHIRITDSVKCSLLDKSFKGEVDPYVINFLKLLVKKRRINYLKEIVSSFKELTNKNLGIEEGVIYTRYDLTEAQVNKIATAIGKRTNKTVKLTTVVDASLIGGIKVEIANKVYDNSIKNKVESLRKQLLRK